MTDPSGNQVLYNYLQDQGAFYPSTITYTGFNGTPGPNTVKFSYEARPVRMTAIEADFGLLNL